MSRETLGQLKLFFRDWYGALSVEEIMSNQRLVRLIEVIEGQILSIEMGYET